MKRTPAIAQTGGFTLIEMLAVIAIIGILAALLLPALMQGKARAKLVWCGNNLAQIGIGFQSFSHEHDSKFPLQVSSADGGVMDTAPLYNNLDLTGASFRAMSGDLIKASLVICPTDTRTAARSFATLTPTNVSYFTSAGADYNNPESILAGDRNITPGSGTVSANGTQPFLWTQTQHNHQGNLLYSDGHVAATKDFLFGGGTTIVRNGPSGSGGATGRPGGPTPLTPEQVSAISAVLNHNPLGFPAAALQPLLVNNLNGLNSRPRASGGFLAAPTVELHTNVFHVPAVVTNTAPETNDDGAAGNLLVRHEAQTSPHYLADGSWLLLILLVLFVAWRLWERWKKDWEKAKAVRSRRR